MWRWPRQAFVCHWFVGLLRIELNGRKVGAGTLTIANHRIAVVLLDDHFTIRFLDRLPHLGLRHNLAHQILNGRLRVQVQQIAQSVVHTVERIRLGRMKRHLGMLLRE